MSKLNTAPAPLKRKFYYTLFVGVGCLLIGLSAFFILKDKTMLFLSLAICLMCGDKAFVYHKLIREEKYEIVEGTCISVTPKPLRKYRKIKIMDDEGNEATMLLGKNSKVKIGYRYRFYFKDTSRFTIGSEFFDSALSSDCFLGYEEESPK